MDGVPQMSMCMIRDTMVHARMQPRLSSMSLSTSFLAVSHDDDHDDDRDDDRDEGVDGDNSDSNDDDDDGDDGDAEH